MSNPQKRKPYKESLSAVSVTASTFGVCSVFGSFLKCEVEVDKETSTCPSARVPSPVLDTRPNAFVVLMQAQRALQCCNNGLPSKKTERTKKDKLFNDIIDFLEKNSIRWVDPMVLLLYKSYAMYFGTLMDTMLRCLRED